MIILGDCIEQMALMPEKSIDFILGDLPFNITNASWDSLIPFEELWPAMWRVLKPNGCIALFASQPFTSQLILSQPKYYKYSWYWNKLSKWSGYLNAKKQPLRIMEEIAVFYRKQPTYNPQMVAGKPYKASSGRDSELYNSRKSVETVNEGLRYPKNYLEFHGREKEMFHPTQKPIDLLEYLIKTYTNESDVVLDCTMGSGSTCLAAKNINRQFIGIEKDQKFYDIACQRLI